MNNIYVQEKKGLNLGQIPVYTDRVLFLGKIEEDIISFQYIHLQTVRTLQ